MRVKSFFISFLFVLSFSFIFAETVTLKTYPTIQTDPERNLKNAEMKLVYDTDDNELYMFFVEDYGWVSRYWFEVGRYGRKKIGKILAKAEEWATAAKSENLTIEKEFPFNEFTGDISRNELKVTDYGRTDICFYFVAEAGKPFIKMYFKPCGIFKQIKPPAQTMTLEDFRDMSEFLNAPNFKDILKAQKAEAKRKNDLLK
jgi:hypothetical protein